MKISYGVNLNDFKSLKSELFSFSQVNELTDPRCTSPTDQQYDQVQFFYKLI